MNFYFLMLLFILHGIRAYGQRSHIMLQTIIVVVFKPWTTPSYDTKVMTLPDEFVRIEADEPGSRSGGSN